MSQATAFLRLVLSDSDRSALISITEQSYPNECCGFLLGRVENGTGFVELVRPVPNILDSPTEFEVDPRATLATFREARQLGLEMLVIFHSHPTSPPLPSRRDRERNLYGTTAAWTIIGREQETWSIRSWWLHESHVEEIRG